MEKGRSNRKYKDVEAREASSRLKGQQKLDKIGEKVEKINIWSKP